MPVLKIFLVVLIVLHGEHVLIAIVVAKIIESDFTLYIRNPI